ncbi:MAG: hypothetical protein GY778_10980, partial [bacterium]|nr:hypothetical protein [bacterium]
MTAAPTSLADSSGIGIACAGLAPAPAAGETRPTARIQGCNIICIANRWDYDPTSKHQVMRILARDNRVLWVNYRGSRRPQASLADAGAVVATLRAVLAGARRID